MRKKIIIWGGNNKSLNLETLDSHASVNAFFLTKYLKKYYDIINIVNIDAPEKILEYDNVYAVIATSQFGFTNRLIKKGKHKLYYLIKNHVNGKLCSIADNNNLNKYYEDILFCVRPVNKYKLFFSRYKSKNPNLLAVHSGWCAEPEVFFPNLNNNRDLNIFINHAPYSSEAKNFISKYYCALKKIKKKFSELNINVFHQNNNGIVKWDFTENNFLNDTYDRTIKIPHLRIAEFYKRIHIFCVTHKESAGLSAIEAAMCGAKIYIPFDNYGRKFIKNDLFNKNIDHTFLFPFIDSIYKQFEKDIINPVDKENNHNNLKISENTWEFAAKIIHKTLL